MCASHSAVRLWTALSGNEQTWRLTPIPSGPSGLPFVGYKKSLAHAPRHHSHIGTQGWLPDYL